ncbi:MAG: KpsF/GutQ family sugar-phosphate isomerase [Pirellulales bacterium]|nr:KpsF/GutQ family sugar-phosphate isomerase [Pirellulales bacterium]MDO7688608.1 KpsF/GutQ family sugar-phosphate isomerase [Pirellulales bacterium]
MVESKNQALLEQAAAVLRSEATAILDAADMLDESFCTAIELLQNCTGSVVVTGMGKAGLIGRKISATLASTGTPSHFLHPAEAMHGDLGVLRSDDLLLAISQSGETAELTQILPHVKSRKIPLIALTSQRSSTLGQFASVVVETGRLVEADSLGVAPSTSTTVMLAIGDSMSLVLSGNRGFSHDDFAARHPGGSLGMRLLKVEEKMRPVECCRLARPEDTVRQVFARPLPSRRTGAVMIVSTEGHLVGIFTDSDLARLFGNHQDDALDRPIGEVMTSEPISVLEGTRLEDAVSLLDTRRISELPVVNERGCPSGLIDIVDLAGGDLSASSKDSNNEYRKHSSAA